MRPQAGLSQGAPGSKLRRYEFFVSRFCYGTGFFPCIVPLSKTGKQKLFCTVPFRTKQYKTGNLPEFRDTTRIPLWLDHAFIIFYKVKSSIIHLYGIISYDSTLPPFHPEPSKRIGTVDILLGPQILGASKFFIVSVFQLTLRVSQNEKMHYYCYLV